MVSFWTPGLESSIRREQDRRNGGTVAWDLTRRGPEARRIFWETYICLPNLLAGGLPAGALAASIASHTRGTTPTHTSNTKHTHASNTTQQKQKLELTMGGCAPSSLVWFLSAVLCLKRVCVCVLCLKCVWVLCRACAKRWKPQAHLQASPQPRD